MSTDRAPPRWLGTVMSLELTGYLFPWKEGQPVFVHVTGSDDLYLPCFQKAEDLRAIMARFDVPFESIKHIDDGFEFLDSIPRKIRIALDLRVTPEGRVRFTQILRGDRGDA